MPPIAFGLTQTESVSVLKSLIRRPCLATLKATSP